jgi:hypothetical protein
VPADPVRRRAATAATLVAVPVALAVGLVSLWAFGAFEGPPQPVAGPRPTSAVTMQAPTLTPEVAEVCRAVVAQLPDAVRDAARRPVTAGPEQNAAYGDPPLTLACGVLTPSLPPTTEVFPLSGVCWAAVPGPGGTVWTTVDRTVGIAVTVPGSPDGSGQSVIPFTKAISPNDPRLPDPPPGCG